MSEQVVAFPSNDYSQMTLLSSALHFFWWTTKGESSLRADARYTPSDGFATFPQPTPTQQMHELGLELDEIRSEVMSRGKLGLTSLIT